MEQIIRKATPTAALLITACSMLGCSDVGIDPPLDRFFNPVALAVDPDGAFLLVANGDFGLAYTSATVVPVDLRKVGQALDDEGLRAGSELQGGPKVVTDALGELAELAVRIGAFAGRMRIDPTGRAAYVSSRRDSTIYALGLQRNGSGQLARIDCGGPDEPLQQCAGIHRLRGHAASDPDTALREPFGFDFLPQLPPAPDRAPRGLMAAYLRSGDLVLFPLDPQTSLPRPGAVQEHLDLQFPSRDVVVHPDGRQAWVTSRLGDELRVIRLP
ncbi:MAG: lactonase family protein, partial [Deltaproteobacteria bacterium]|nr:lactonase family protein [Deltaproteobacteria bacterium]